MARRKARPSDPAAIAAAAAHRRAAERASARDPATWGLAEGLQTAAGGEAVSVVEGARGRVTRARRQDHFDLLAGTGAITPAQRGAAARYVADRVGELGVSTADTWSLVVTAGGWDDGVRQRTLDAGRRVRIAEAAIGRVDLELLRGLVDPMLAGQVRVWREIVRMITGETERHAQAGRVRASLENLRAGYQAIDAGEIGPRRRPAPTSGAAPEVDSGRTGP